jgi:antitoxin component of MazEF toxin-antitoxin module
MGETRIKGRINEWGNSIAIRIPKTAANLLAMKKGEDVDFVIDSEKNSFCVVKTSKRAEREPIDLKELVAQYRPEQDHPLHEVSGAPKGKEYW